MTRKHHVYFKINAGSQEKMKKYDTFYNQFESYVYAGKLCLQNRY